jgi:hypothetical protein
MTKSELAPDPNEVMRRRCFRKRVGMGKIMEEDGGVGGSSSCSILSHAEYHRHQTCFGCGWSGIRKIL